eukprot:2651693-Rhodomonas_salina.1
MGKSTSLQPVIDTELSVELLHSPYQTYREGHSSMIVTPGPDQTNWHFALPLLSQTPVLASSTRKVRSRDPISPCSRQPKAVSKQ